MDQHTSSHPSGLPTREEAEKMKEQNPSKGNLPEKDKMYREMFFPTCIYFWDHPEPTKTNDQIKKNVDHWYKRDQEGIIRSNSLGWHSAVDMHHRNEYNHITKWIFDKAQQVFNDHGYDPDSEPICDNMWANINKRYSHNRNHIHPGALWSGVYYIQAPEKSGRIWFTDPRGEAHMLMPRYKERQNFTWREVYYEPVVGRLIIFPAWLVHEVEPNLNKEFEEDDSRGWRYSISFNFNQGHRPDAKPRKERKGHDSGGVVSKEDLE
mgnify:CR=1 FL=1